MSSNICTRGPQNKILRFTESSDPVIKLYSLMDSFVCGTDRIRRISKNVNSVWMILYIGFHRFIPLFVRVVSENFVIGMFHQRI